MSLSTIVFVFVGFCWRRKTIVFLKVFGRARIWFIGHFSGRARWERRQRGRRRIFSVWILILRFCFCRIKWIFNFQLCLAVITFTRLQMDGEWVMFSSYLGVVEISLIFQFCLLRIFASHCNEWMESPACLHRHRRLLLYNLNIPLYSPVTCPHDLAWGPIFMSHVPWWPVLGVSQSGVVNGHVMRPQLCPADGCCAECMFGPRRSPQNNWCNYPLLSPTLKRTPRPSSAPRPAPGDSRSRVKWVPLLTDKLRRMRQPAPFNHGSYYGDREHPGQEWFSNGLLTLSPCVCAESFQIIITTVLFQNVYVNISRILTAANKLVEGGHYAGGHVRWEHWSFELMFRFLKFSRFLSLDPLLPDWITPGKILLPVLTRELQSYHCQFCSTRKQKM